ncbi:hypothetical protein K502DRAFT_350974 [Neoconidiobolus thromboides FSU 785]|nr:hypothetical protein K502DRAFT_350974 [Neoconidiobolus thromboides FSU 785]
MTLMVDYKYLEPISKEKVCFQCQQRKVKCDKKKPQCSACIKRKQGCTYPKIFKKSYASYKISNYSNLNSNDNEGSIEALSGTDIESSSVVTESSDCSSNVLNNNRCNGSVSNNKSERKNSELYDNDKCLNQNNNVVAFRNKIQFRFMNKTISYNPKQIKVSSPLLKELFSCSWVRYLNVNIGIDYLLKNQKKVEVNLFLSSISIKQSANNIQEEGININSLFQSELFFKSVNCFFEQFNKYVPFFLSYESFVSKKRSPLLLFSVYVVGLMYLNEKEMVKGYEERLLFMLNPLSNKISLDYIQALMISFWGLKGLLIAKNLGWISGSLILSLCSMIGIQYSSKDESTNIEKFLLYNNITYEVNMKYLCLNYTWDYIPVNVKFNNNVIRVLENLINKSQGVYNTVLVVKSINLFNKLILKFREMGKMDKKQLLTLLKFIDIESNQIYINNKSDNNNNNNDNQNNSHNNSNYTIDNSVLNYLIIEKNLRYLIVIKRYLQIEYPSYKGIYYKKNTSLTKEETKQIQEIHQKEKGIITHLNQMNKQFLTSLIYFNQSSNYIDRLIPLTFFIIFNLKFYSILNYQPNNNNLLLLKFSFNLLNQSNFNHPFYSRIIFHSFILNLINKMLN